jgi:hypothetical protein
VTGLTAGFLAAEKGNMNVVKFLVENGADVNRKNNEGKTPLDIIGESTEVYNFIKNAGGKKGEYIP